MSRSQQESENSRPERRVMHLDMDAFFASIEQLDDPSLKGKPVIVGGTSDRSVVSAASYEARRFGVHSAMPTIQARKLCPHGVFLPVRGSRYREVSKQVMAVLESVSPLVEKASVDEAYVDITGTERLFGSSLDMGRMVKDAIRQTTGLTCSVGIAPNKFLAKIASDLEKPDGLTVITPSMVRSFLDALPVQKIPGVGKRTLAALEGLAVKTCGDVLKYPRSFWERRMGKAGGNLYDKALGKDDRPVTVGSEAKSCSAERTFGRDTDDRNTLETMLLQQAERVGRELRASGLKGRTVTLKLKYADHQSLTRSHSLHRLTCATETIFNTAKEMLDRIPLAKKVRLIGVGVSNFRNEVAQLDLLPNQEAGLDQLDRTLDCIRDRFGWDAIVRGKLFGPGEE